MQPDNNDNKREKLQSMHKNWATRIVDIIESIDKRRIYGMLAEGMSHLCHFVSRYDFLSKTAA